MRWIILGASALCCCKSGACSGSKPGQVGWPADEHWSKGRCCMDFAQAKCPWQNALKPSLPNPLAPTAYSMPVEGSCDVETAQAAQAAQHQPRPSGVLRRPDAEVSPSGQVSDSDGADAADVGAGAAPLLFGAPLHLTGCRCELPHCELQPNGAQKKVYGQHPDPEQCDLSTITVVVMSLRDAPEDRLYENIGRPKGMSPGKNGRPIRTGDVVGVFPEAILTSGQDAILANSLLPHDAAFVFAASAKAYGIVDPHPARARARPALAGGEVLEFTPALVGPQVFGQLEALVAGHDDLQHCAFFLARAGKAEPRRWNELAERDAQRLKALASYGAEGGGAMARLFRREQPKPQLCTDELYQANPRICLKERACTWSQEAQRCAFRSGL